MTSWLGNTFQHLWEEAFDHRYNFHRKAPVIQNDVFFGVQYIPRNMHTVFALLCFVVIIHWLIFPYPSGLLHWHCGNLTIAPVPAKQPWWIWINTSCEFIMNDYITTTKQSTTKRCAYFFGYTVSLNKLLCNRDVGDVGCHDARMTSLWCVGIFWGMDYTSVQLAIIKRVRFSPSQ